MSELFARLPALCAQSSEGPSMERSARDGADGRFGSFINGHKPPAPWRWCKLSCKYWWWWYKCHYQNTILKWLSVKRLV